MFDIHPLNTQGGFNIGIELAGLDPERLVDGAIREELRRLWVEYGLIVFRGIEGEDVQIALSKVFGPLMGHVAKPVDEEPGLVNIRHDPASGNLYEVDGVRLGGWLPWHFDHVYVPDVNHGGVLRPRTLPKAGGETGFIDKIMLYESLDAGLKARIEGKSIRYKWDLDVSRQQFARRPGARVVQWSDTFAEMQSRIDHYPEVLHPAVFVQQETGRKVLNVSPWMAMSIDGMDTDEGNALLEAVCQHCVDERFAYYHSYRLDDMVLWDNWRMLHCASGVRGGDSRWMQRTTIAGDYGLGRLADASATVDERIRVNI